MGLLDRFFGPPSRDKFARMLMSGLKRAGDPRTTHYDPKEFRLTFDKDGTIAGINYLGNIYNEYCRTPPAERAQRMRHVIRALLSLEKLPPDEFADVGPDLLPLVRGRSFFSFLELERENGEAGPQTPYVEIGSHLAAALVYDFPESMSYITHERLETWDATFYTAMELARDNLREREAIVVRFGDHLFTWATGDGYDSSRILLTDTIRELGVQGDPIAVIPNRDTLLVTGSEDPIGLELMAEVSGKLLDEPGSVSALALRLDGDDWEPWLPSADHPLHDKYRLLEFRSLFSEYLEQKKLLDAYHQDRGLAVRAADYLVNETKDHKAINVCVWPEGVEALLPKTQLMVFSRPGENVAASGHWSNVERIVGHLMEPVRDLYPPRFRVTDFPSDAELKGIGRLPL